MVAARDSNRNWRGVRRVRLLLRVVELARWLWVGICDALTGKTAASFSRMGSAWVRHGFGFGVPYRVRGTAGAGYTPCDIA